MSILALHLLHQRFEITGSDLQDGDQAQRLREAGIPVAVGHRPENIDSADLVVVTAAVTPSNPELVAARSAHIPIVKRAELLGEIMGDAGRPPLGLAISGTHGKTTTTALIGHILRGAGQNVAVLAGGVVHDAGLVHMPTPAAYDPTDTRAILVVEADEYDRSFHWLHPDVAVVTNIEYDHPDCYPTLLDMEQAYQTFMRQVEGTLIVCADSEVAARLAEASGRYVVTYGVHESADWRAVEPRCGATTSTFLLDHRGHQLQLVEVPLPGLHNIANSLAALATVDAVGVEPSVAAGLLAGFPGVERRLQVKGTVRGIVVVDAYAHHPTEIRADLAAIRPRGGRLRVLFQPHTYTRTQALISDFATAFDLADEVILLDIYGAREQPIPGVTGENLAQAVAAHRPNARYYVDRHDAVSYIVESAASGDVILTAGAGDVGQLGPQILDKLAVMTA